MRPCFVCMAFLPGPGGADFPAACSSASVSMKFDVIIGNPPYQQGDGGYAASARPLYHLFVQQAFQFSPRLVVMIIPARWYAGGKGLHEFRRLMLSDPHIRELHDFPHTADCFSGVNIRGGVCYFLWDREYDNRKALVKVVTHMQGRQWAALRSLIYRGFDIFLRYAESLSILDKVMKKCRGKVMSAIVSARRPFGLATDFIRSRDFHEDAVGLVDPVLCYGRNMKKGWVEFSKIPLHAEWAGRWKVFTPRANNIGTELKDDNLNDFTGRREICTESYLVIGAELNLSQEQAQHLAAYLKTRFARFCHSMAKSSHDATARTYRFVPWEDFSRPWTDEMLYAAYGLNGQEIAFIEAMIKPMD